MAMRLSATMEVSCNIFSQLCDEMNLPSPEVDEEYYFAAITEKMYDVYSQKARELYYGLENGVSINQLEHRFLSYWRIIYDARIERLVENDSFEEVWEDLHFC